MPQSLQSLTILTWPDYIAPETIQGFEREHGARGRM
jgi:spermidine/putrescine-binding protein